jgi:uridine monophosphate synthetase
MQQNIKELILDLHRIEVVKFGEFKLKSGIMSPIYLDLRLAISYPEVLKKIAGAMWEVAKSLAFDLICGVPYTAIPFATLIAAKHNIPMLMCRKEQKEHGTKKIVEGAFKAGQKCLVIEDLITSGTSILETVAPLEEVGLQVNDAIVVIDREQGGKLSLANKGYNVHAVFTLGQMLEVLQNANKIDTAMVEKIKKFLKNSK